MSPADGQPLFEFDQTAAERERRVRDLPTFYYHGHFVELLNFVSDSYAHVLDVEHRRFLDDFHALGYHAQCLYVRLSNRKGRVFAERRLRYPELGRIEPLLAELADREFIAAPGPEHFEDLLRFLTRDAIRSALLPDFAGLGRGMRKADLVAFARANCERDDFVKRAAGSGVFVQRRCDAIRYVSFLYFGRVQDGLNRFTMRDLGLVRVHEFRDDYEPRFSDRDEAAEHYFYACELKALERADDHQVIEQARRSANWPEPNWPGSAADRDRLCYRIGQRLEKIGEPALALEIYGRAEAPRCTERIVRILFKAKRREEAEQYLVRCIDAPRSEEEFLFARDLYERRFHAKRTSALTDTLRGGDVIELDESLSGSPERAAAEYYERRGATAFRTENALWRTLFGLLFWPELFGGRRAALHSPFEFLPRNLETGTFAADNASQVAERLRLLDDSKALKRHLLAISTSNFGTDNGVFRWRRSVLDAVFALIDAAPAPAMRAILERLCMNFRDSRYGYPDLMLVDDDGVRFVEVKTDGDQLRRNQLTRIEQLRAAGFRAGISRIRWTLDPRTTYVVVDVETTGGRGENHRVTEIGAVKVRNGEVVDRFATLINPQRTIPPSITRLTGISADMVADAPYFSDVADSFSEFLSGSIFVAHNVDFDYGFIAREFRRLGRPFRYPKLCTCASMRRLYPGQRSYSLNALCSAFDIPLKNHHRALCDAEAAAELLLLINEKRAERLADAAA